MKSIKKLFSILILSSLTSGCVGLFSWDKAKSIKTVKLNSIDDVMGCWYVITAIPNFIEEGVEDSIECYKLSSDGSIEARFKFYRDGKYKEIKMNAEVRWDKNPDGGVWGMKFRWKNLLPLPQVAYFILEFDEIYDEKNRRDIKVAVIGGPTEKTLWIIASEPQISESLLNNLKLVAAPYYDVEALKMVPQIRNQKE